MTELKTSNIFFVAMVCSIAAFFTSCKSAILYDKNVRKEFIDLANKGDSILLNNLSANPAFYSVTTDTLNNAARKSSSITTIVIQADSVTTLDTLRKYQMYFVKNGGLANNHLEFAAPFLNKIINVYLHGKNATADVCYQQNDVIKLTRDGYINNVVIIPSTSILSFDRKPDHSNDFIYGKVNITTAPYYVTDPSFTDGHVKLRDHIILLFRIMQRP